MARWGEKVIWCRCLHTADLEFNPSAQTQRGADDPIKQTSFSLSVKLVLKITRNKEHGAVFIAQEDKYFEILETWLWGMNVVYSFFYQISHAHQVGILSSGN